MFLCKTGLTGITKCYALLDFDITVRAIAFFAVRMFMLFFADGFRTGYPGQFILIILDGLLKGIRPQVGAVQFVFGSLLVSCLASARLLPLAISVIILDTAIAEPHPKV
jgi:ABC-type phosphate transport system permease subunit